MQTVAAHPLVLVSVHLYLKMKHPMETRLQHSNTVLVYAHGRLHHYLHQFNQNPLNRKL